jgi:hypothetical protein
MANTAVTQIRKADKDLADQLAKSAKGDGGDKGGDGR